MQTHGSFKYNSRDAAGNALKYANKKGFAVLAKDGKIHIGDQPRDKKLHVRDLTGKKDIFAAIEGITAFPEVKSANGARKKVMEVYGPAKKLPKGIKPYKRASTNYQPQVRVAGKKEPKPFTPIKGEYTKAEVDHIIAVYEGLLWLSENGKSQQGQTLVNKVMGR